jgi:hypothetical protein
MNDHHPRAAACACALLAALALVLSTAIAADGRVDPLHVRIDRLIDADRIGPPVAMASDGEFLRRVSLDLNGMPPSVEELRAFLADQSPDKRARAIDRLLDSTLFARHWATTLDIMLMERRAAENVAAEEWQAYLLDAARRNRPFNDLVGELLRADGGDMKHRAPARFYLDRESEPNRIARDVGRIFFGRDLQCAQCHNHPLVQDYRQSDYQGLLAFFSPSEELVKMEGMKKTTFFPEKAGTDVAFDSVFVKDDHHLTGPRLPDGTEVDEPTFPPGDEYKVKPAGFVMPVPRHSRRAMLASFATGGNSRAFNENFANRLWAMMMGRGLVHPMDLGHPSNPPIHPELLAMLGREIAALKFDVKPFLRELALTRAYQRAMDLPGDVPPLPSSATAELGTLKARSAALEAEVERAHEVYRKAEKAWHRAESALIPLAAERDKAVAKHTEVTKKEEEARTALAAADAAVAARRDTSKALVDVAGRAQEVAKKLPKEKELADAARVFANRSAAAATELAALEKASVEKGAALKKIGEERAAVARSIEAAWAKARPVRESVRKEESLALEARRKLADRRTALENHQRRTAALEAYSRWQGLRERIAANQREVEGLRSAFESARQRSGEQAAVLKTRQEEAKAADGSRVAADKDHADATSALERNQKATASIRAALAATEAARELLAGDPALSDAAEKLEAKSRELDSGLAGLNGRVQAAGSVLRKAAETVKAANDVLMREKDEQRRRTEGVGAAQSALGAAESRGQALQKELAEATDDLASAQGSRFVVAQLKPLTPEQMCWSILKVTGVYDRYRAAEEAELAKAKPLKGPAADDPAVRRDRAIEIEQRTFDKLKGNLPTFIRVYGAGAGQPQHDFFATADQALFAANGGSLNGWIAPGGGNVSQRMIGEKDGRKAAEELYLTILCRPPTQEESAEVARLLSVSEKDKPAVVQELVWGLLASAEFRFNH